MATLAALIKGSVFIKEDADPQNKDAFYIVVSPFKNGKMVIRKIKGGNNQVVSPGDFGNVAVYNMKYYKGLPDTNQRI